MGMDLSVGIMPYLFIKNNVYDVEKVNLACLNTACGGYKKITNNKFCPHCGQEVKSFNTTEKVCKRVYDVFLENELDEDFMYEVNISGLKKEESVVIGNHRSPFENWIDTNESKVKELSLENPFQIKEQIEWFKEHYSKPIEALKKVFGDDNVEIKFGIISYWS